MKKFFEKLKEKLRKKPASELPTNGQAAPPFSDQDEQSALSDKTNPEVQFDPSALEGEAQISQSEAEADDEEDIPIPLKEMKLGDVSQEFTATHSIEMESNEDVPPVPEHEDRPYEGTQEIRIDPIALEALRANDPELNKPVTDDEDVSFKTMKIPSSVKPKGFQLWFGKAREALMPLWLKTKTQFDLWQKKRVAQGHAEISWDRIVENIFSPQNRPDVHQLFLALSLVTGAYGIGKITAYLIKGVEERIKPPSIQAQATKPLAYPIGAIKTANLFNTQVEKGATGEDGKPRLKTKDFGQKVCKEASRNSSLPLELTNTIVLQDTVKSVAAVAIRGEKEIISVREGEKIKAMAEVGKIDRLKLIVKNLSSGECEYIENKELGKDNRPLNIVGEKEGKKLMQSFSNQEISNEGNKFKIKKAFRDKMLENIGEVLTQARAVQMKNPDGTLAFKMTEIIPGSIYSQLNIKDEDIITKINGKEIGSLNDIMSMFGSIKDIEQLSITVSRDGVELDMDYRFE